MNSILIQTGGGEAGDTSQCIVVSAELGVICIVVSAVCRKGGALCVSFLVCG